MSERIESVIVVTDKGSQTFLKVGDSAQKMGNTIDQATTKASRSTDNLAKRQAALGAVFATFTGVLSTASQANAEAEASQARLNTAIEDSGHFMSEYQTQLDAASKKALQLGFDDEDAADSIAKLTTATGDANKAISDLAIAEDISRARKIDLASATQIVIAAEQGRVGALARIGIQVDKNSTAEERLDALRNQFAGNAEAYAATEAGAHDRLTNSIENEFEAIGHLLGPTQQYLMLLPGLSAGFTAAGAAVGALAPEMTAASAAAGLLNAALGPIGLAFLAVGAGVAVFELSKHLGSDLPAGAAAANDALQKTNDILKQQIQLGAVTVPLAKDISDSFGSITPRVQQYTDKLDELTAAQTDTASAAALAKTQFGEHSDYYLELQKNADDAATALQNYIDTQGKGMPTIDEARKANQAANQILTDTSKAAPAAQKRLQELTDAVQSGKLSWADYTKYVTGLSSELPEMAIRAQQAAAATDKQTAATKKGTDANKEYINTLTGYLQGQKVLGQQYTDLGDNTGQLVTSQRVLHDQILTLDNDGRESVATMEAEAAASKAAAAAFVDQAGKVGYLDTELEKLIGAGVSTWAERTANRVITATSALGDNISVIIDGTKNLSSQSQNLNDWAVDLINVAGGYGKIDDLLAHGQITLTTYNRAQDAGTRIIADNAAVQEDLLRIQAKQAPLLADLADKQAKYIDQLADLPPQQELVALGWMDQNEAAKANAALNLAAAAAAGEYGDAGEKAATAAITAQAQADPAFAAMLRDMGLISVGADGTISVNFPDSETIQDAVDNLTGAVEDMTAALLGVPPDVYTQITANDNATSVIDAVRADLNSLNGTAVYTSVYTTYIASTPGAAPGYHPTMLGGIIPHAQTGIIPRDSRVTMVGEAGPELVRLPGGSMVYPHGASMEMATRLGKGSGGDIHLHNSTINLYPPDTNVYDALRAQLYSGGRG